VKNDIHSCEKGLFVMLTKQFRFLWLGQGMANFGDVLYVVALISMVYQVTESALFTSFVPVMFVVAQFISGMLAPLLLDRFRLSSLLVASQLGKTSLLLVMTIFSSSIFTQPMLTAVLVLVFLLAFLDGWATPARNALIPRLVSQEALVKANSLMATTDQSVQFIGWASGGILVVWLGSQNILWVSFVLYVFSALLMALLRTEDQQNVNVPRQKGWKSLREGWEKIWQTPLLRTVTIADLLECVAGGVWIAAILLVYVKEVLAKGDEWWGFINASYMAGMIAGGIIVLAMEKKMSSHLLRPFFWGTLFSGLITLAFGFTTLPLLALVLSVILGPFHQLQFVSKQTILQSTVEPELLPKVYAAKNTLDSLFFGLSVVLMSFLSDVWGVTTVYSTAAILSGLAALLIMKHTLTEKRA
jgi:MFS family permease